MRHHRTELLVSFCVLADVVNVGFTRSWGRWPQRVFGGAVLWVMVFVPKVLNMHDVEVCPTWIGGNGTEKIMEGGEARCPSVFL